MNSQDLGTRIEGHVAVEVEVSALRKSFAGETALDDVSFTVPAGSTLALLGPSGCGKSTTLAIIAGITQADSGVVMFGGQTMNDVAIYRRQVGVVFQSYALFPHMSVERNVEFGPRVQGIPGRERAALVDEALSLTNLTKLRKRLPSQLSGGQRQRVALARALAVRPKVLLLDEPLSNLDAHLRERMQYQIRDVQRRSGITMIFVTHDQQEALAIGDQVAVMFDGRIRQVGSPIELYNEPHDLEVGRSLGKTNLLPCTVKCITGDTAELVGQNGERWRSVVVPDVKSELRPGAAATVMVRPENLRIAADQPSSANSIRGVAKRATFLGREANVLVDGGYVLLEILSQVSTSSLLGLGDEIFVEWDEVASRVFPARAVELSPVRNFGKTLLGGCSMDMTNRRSEPAVSLELPSSGNQPDPTGTEAAGRGGGFRWPRVGQPGYWLSSPAAVMLIVLFLLPLALLLAFSFFTYNPLTGMHSVFTASNYQYLWRYSFVRVAFLRTVEIGLTATIVTALIAYPTALILDGRGPRVRTLGAVIIVAPLFVSAVERSLGWVAILGPDGVVSSIAGWLHLPAPKILFTQLAVTIGLVNIMLPFMFMPIFTALRRVDPDVRAAAASLGASPLRAFAKVTGPLTLPGLAAGSVLVFSLSATNFVTTSMLGGAGLSTAPTLLYQQASGQGDFPQAAAFALALCVVVIVVVAVIGRLMRSKSHELVVLPQ